MGALRWPVVVLLCAIIAVHLTVEVANHLHPDLLPQWRPLDYAALLALPVELVALGLLTRAGRRRAVIARRTRKQLDVILAEENLSTAFQPIFDLDTGDILGVEALSRFPGQPPNSPDVWFSEAHQSGRGKALELLAVRTALRTAADLPHQWYISVNVSPSTLADPALLASLIDSAVSPARVVVELTEHAQVTDYPALQGAIRQLRAHGVRLAVDDAGAGHSSLRHVLILEPDFIKLDRSLITDIDQDRARRALVVAVVVFALELKISVVAEGVERHGELDTLRTLAVDGAQGYLLGRPSTDAQQWQSWAAAATATGAPPRVSIRAAIGAGQDAQPR